MYIIISKEDSVSILVKSYRDLNYDILLNDNNNGYVERANKKLVNIVPIAFFSNFKIANSRDKFLEEISHAHIVSSLSKLKTSAEGTDDLSIGFDRSRDSRQNEFTINETLKKISCYDYAQKSFWFCRAPGKRYAWLRIQLNNKED